MEEGTFRNAQEGIPVKFSFTQANEGDTGVGKGMLGILDGLIIAKRACYKDVLLSQFTKEGDRRAVVRLKSRKNSSLRKKH